jgi:hypothetical protein
VDLPPAVAGRRLGAVEPGLQRFQADVPAGRVACCLTLFGERVGEDQQAAVAVRVQLPAEQIGAPGEGEDPLGVVFEYLAVPVRVVLTLAW